MERRQAGVIVLHEQISDSLILTMRSKKLRAHPGEICFPGGSWEKNDQTLLATALRELYEELGILPERVILQTTMTCELTLSGFLIQPYFAAIENLEPYHLNQEEVDAIIRVPFKEVGIPQNYQSIKVERNGMHLKSWQFLHQDYTIWGATARIMKQFCRSPI